MTDILVDSALALQTGGPCLQFVKNKNEQNRWKILISYINYQLLRSENRTKRIEYATNKSDFLSLHLSIN